MKFNSFFKENSTPTIEHIKKAFNIVEIRGNTDTFMKILELIKRIQWKLCEESYEVVLILSKNSDYGILLTLDHLTKPHSINKEIIQQYYSITIPKMIADAISST